MVALGVETMTWFPLTLYMVAESPVFVDSRGWARTDALELVRHSR